MPFVSNVENGFLERTKQGAVLIDLLTHMTLIVIVRKCGLLINIFIIQKRKMIYIIINSMLLDCKYHVHLNGKQSK